MSRQRSRLTGWSSTDTAGAGWKRNRDWFGWHTITAAPFGIAIPLTIGFVAGAFGEIGTGTRIDNSPAGLKARARNSGRRRTTPRTPTFTSIAWSRW